jgi:hypothetical protein
MQSASKLFFGANESKAFSWPGGLAEIIVSSYTDGTFTIEESIDDGATWVPVKQDTATTYEITAAGSYGLYLGRGEKAANQTSGVNKLIRMTLAGGATFDVDVYIQSME